MRCARAFTVQCAPHTPSAKTEPADRTFNQCHADRAFNQCHADRTFNQCHADARLHDHPPALHTQPTLPPSTRTTPSSCPGPKASTSSRTCPQKSSRVSKARCSTAVTRLRTISSTSALVARCKAHEYCNGLLAATVCTKHPYRNSVILATVGTNHPHRITSRPAGARARVCVRSRARARVCVCVREWCVALVLCPKCPTHRAATVCHPCPFCSAGTTLASRPKTSQPPLTGVPRLEDSPRPKKNLQSAVRYFLLSTGHRRYHLPNNVFRHGAVRTHSHGAYCYVCMHWALCCGRLSFVFPPRRARSRPSRTRGAAVRAGHSPPPNPWSRPVKHIIHLAVFKKAPKSGFKMCCPPSTARRWGQNTYRIQLKNI